VLLEALATGTPVVSTPVGYAPELLPPDALFPVGDVSALAARLQRWLYAQAQRQTISAQALADEQLSITRMQQQIANELAALLSQHDADPKA
jgi:glycosyltransferase involved in cell wall biosynthesis